MAGELYNYLPSDVSADYTAEQLTLVPQQVMPVRAGWAQKKVEYDDRNVAVNTFGQNAKILAELRFNYLEDSEMGTLFDLYLNGAKAWGMQNTFEWVSPNVWPVDGYTYIVRFWSEQIEALIRYVHGFQSLLLWLEGYKSV